MPIWGNLGDESPSPLRRVTLNIRELAAPSLYSLSPRDSRLTQRSTLTGLFHSMQACSWTSFELIDACPKVATLSEVGHDEQANPSPVDAAFKIEEVCRMEKRRARKTPFADIARVSRVPSDRATLLSFVGRDIWIVSPQECISFILLII